jgi:ferredoxin
MGREPRRIGAPDLDAMLDELAATGTLVAPVDRAGEVVFERVESAAAIHRDYVNSLAPPKDLLLPSRERLAAYSFVDGRPVLGTTAAAAPAETVLFGVRSCDVAGFEYLERYLGGGMFGRPELEDRPFRARRDALTVISVVCQRPGPTCLCVCCQGGPALEHGFDWQLTALERGWLVEIGSAKGERLAARWAERLAPADPAAVAEKAARVQETIAHFDRFSTRRVQTMAASRMTSTGRLPRAFWERIGERCFQCGGCAFVCPTCYCFNVADVGPPGATDGCEGELRPARERGAAAAVPNEITCAPREGDWERVRLRDCCQLPGFVRQAGGGYPRWTTGERCLTRFFHKLSWQFHERMGRLGCTGCGRCVAVCPGGIGIDVVAEEMTAALRGPGAAGPTPAPRPGAGA